MASRLTPEERRALLPALGESGWDAAPEGDAICKTWRFGDFSEAFGFMARVALCAEKMDHHPDWRNVWNRVEITLSTHSCDGLSVLDIELAGCIDAMEAGQTGKPVTGARPISALMPAAG